MEIELNDNESGEIVEEIPRINYAEFFKKRLLKQLIQWLIIGTVTIVVLATLALQHAYAAAPRCVGLDGTGTKVGSGNSGVLDFTNDPLTSTYAGVLCEPTVAGDDFELHGWVWDTNFGWVSLSCNAAGTNAGLFCGGIEYGVKIDKQTGNMYGWAWADNVGWISFGCGSQGIAGDNNGFSCGNINYSGSVAGSSVFNQAAQLDIDANLGTVTGYAWADTVGWFNLDGVQAQMLQLMMPVPAPSETTIGIWTKVENDIDCTQFTTKTEIIECFANRNNKQNRNTAPPADGTGGYETFIHITDTNGDPVITGGPVTVTIDPDWTDTVQWDQTDPVSTTDYSLANKGPAEKALTFSYVPGETTTAGIGGSYYGFTTSFAPTDGVKFTDEDGSGVPDAVGEKPYSFLSDNTLQTNTLSYNGAWITVELDHGGGDIETWGPNLISPLGFTDMEFMPVVELDTVFQVVGTTKQSTIESYRNRFDTYELSVAENGSLVPFGGNYAIKATLSVDPTVVNIENYVWLDDPEGDPTLASDTLSFSTSNAPLKPTQYLAFPSAPTGELAEEQVTDAKVISEVTLKYGGSPIGTIKYLTSGMPRVATASIINQAAEFLSGTVSAPSAQTVQTFNVITTVGDIATNRIRTNIVQNVSSIIAGAQLTDTIEDPITVSTDLDFSKMTLVAGGQAYYVKGKDVKLDLNLFNPAEPITFIIDGGNLFLDSNVIDKTSAIGFIILKNLNTGEGGMTYIHSDVTDLVNVYFYSDGSVFRYTDGICYLSGSYNGLDYSSEPNFVLPNAALPAGLSCPGGSYMDPIAILTNQIYINGSAIWQNTLGGSILNDDGEVVRGDGKSLGGATPINFALAQLYDINYLARYDGTGTASSSISETGPIYFDYSPIPSNLPGFTNL